MKRLALAIPARNKEKWVGACCESALAQTITEPFDIYFSDQGSEDGTLAVMEAAAQAYNGPHRVHILKCPDTEMKGMFGLNAHYNWLHSQIDADFVMMSSADDTLHESRAARTFQILEEYDPSYIGTMQMNRDENGEYAGHTAVPDPEAEPRFYSLTEIVERNIGGSISSAWSMDLFEKYGPLRGAMIQDVIVPVWAAMERGFFYLNEPLQNFWLRPDPNNTGLESIRDQRADDPEFVSQINEVMCYSLASSHYAAFMALQWRLERAEAGAEELPEGLQQAYGPMMNKWLNYAATWCDSRTALTMQHIEPMGYPA